MRIAELWIPEFDEETAVVKSYIEATVLFTQKKTVFVDGKPAAEAVFAVAYINDSGRLVDVALEDCTIKTLYQDDKKDKEPISFSMPRPGDAGAA